MAQHNETGHKGEQLAADYLRSKGYTIRDMDWRQGHRDLDIIALTPDMLTLVFVEVKTRTDDYLTSPELAIDLKKIRNLGLAANSYVKQNRITLDLRFDIITVVSDPDSHSLPRIEHWEDAFNPMLI